MNPDDPSGRREEVKALSRGLRLDLVIAVCALLISSLATAASWWQTRVLQQQLGAQVWPYVAVGETIDDDKVRLSIRNDGLGPAVLRNETVTVDGRREGGFVAVLHALLGPHLMARRHKGEPMGIDESQSGAGSVLRSGATSDLLTFTSKRFAFQFLRASQRIDIHICYCAIIPGKCWQNDSQSSRDPEPLASCPNISNDLLHASTYDMLDPDL